MTREDWHMVAEIADDAVYDEPASAEERVWNMAVRHVGVAIRRAGLTSAWRDVSAPAAASTEGAA